METLNYFDELLNHLTSEEKDHLCFILEVFQRHYALSLKADELLNSMLKDIAES